MKRLVDWLAVEWGWGRAVVAMFASVFLWLSVVYWLNAVIPGYGPDLSKGSYPFWFVIVAARLSTFIRALLEEVLFRLAPMCLAVAVWHRSRAILLVALGASIIFAVSHRVDFPVYITHCIFGMIWCFLFLKCGGCRKNDWRGPAKALLITTISHALFNIGFNVMFWYVSLPVKLAF